MDHKEFFSDFKTIKICFFKENFNFEDLCTLIAIKSKFRKMKVVFQQLHGLGEFHMIKEHELEQINALINFEDDLDEILYSRYSEEHKALVEFSENLSYKSIFSSDEVTLIEQTEDFDKMDLKHVWLLAKGKEDTMLFQTIIASKFTEIYEHKKGFIKKIAEGSQSNIHNIFLNIVDYIKIHGYKDFKPKEKPLIRKFKNYQLKKNVVIIHNPVEKNIDAFKLYPEAKFSISYWNSGIIQIRKNNKIAIEFFDLPNMVNIVMDKYKQNWEKKIIPMSTIKWVFEKVKHPFDSFSFDYFETLPFTTFYGSRKHVEAFKASFQTFMKPYKELDNSELKMLDRVGISFWDLIPLLVEESPSLINISIFPYYGKPTRPNRIYSLFKTDKSYKLCRDFVFYLYRALNAV